ncbi:hypothetical protein [Marinobacter sp. OP 3.4]|uniref:hypothetical protein n=1 Tax=Marinobacter sp. OP 3.4 TaxID=3076501 RepID=UPI002E1DCEC4
MNIELTNIAEKKLEQMGATVHGVLAKNEAGAWAAVSEAGRVMWLDGFEGQSSSAEPCRFHDDDKEACETYSGEVPCEPEQPRAGVVPEGWRLVPVEPTKEMTQAAFDAFEVVNPMQYGNGHEARKAVYDAMLTAAPAVQGGGEPDWTESATLDSEAWKNPLLSKNDRLQIADGAVAWRDEVICNLRATATHPHNGEQGGEWVRCDERLPTEIHNKVAGLRALLWRYDWRTSLNRSEMDVIISDIERLVLTRPQPPKSKGGA